MVVSEKKIVDTGEVVCGFGVRRDLSKQVGFDECYKETTIKQRVKKVGDGENDFIIEEYEEVKLTPIREVLDAQVDQVGIEAYIRPYQLAGVPLPDVEVGEDVLDVSQFPEDPADAMKVGDEMMKNFYSLDPALRGDAKTPEEFLANLTQEKFDNWLMSKTNVEKEVKNEG